MAIPTNAWDEGKPAGTRDINLGDDDIREMKTQVREIIGVDHQIANAGSGDDWGKHTILTLLIQAAMTTVVGAGRVGVKVISGIAELFYRDDAGTETQITNNGSLTTSFTAGMIIMWSGTLATIPTGWALCDGVGGRPNLLNKFVRGVSTAATNPGTVGGSDTHGTPSHTLIEAEIPAHTHTLTTWRNGTAYIPGRPDAYTNNNPNGNATTDPTGGNGGHTHPDAYNIPVYYEIAYIIKT